MNEQSKLLYVINQDWYFCLHWLERAKASRDAGYRVGVIMPSGEKVEEIRENGFEVFTTPISRKGLNPVTEFFSFVGLFIKVKNYAPDIIHTVTVKPNTYGAIVGRMLKIPTASSVTGLGNLRQILTKQRGVLKIFKKLLIQLFKFAGHFEKYRLLFENNDDRELFIKLRILERAKTRVIFGAGVNTSLFNYSREPDSQNIKILLAARMLKNKGLYELVEASKLLHKQDLSFEISIVGIIDKDNPNNIPLNQLIKWDAEGWIRWLGEENNMPEVIKSSHLVALPTFYGEGIPRFLIEAASCGRPIVTTDIPGCRELVKNGINGLLVQPKDSVSLAHALGILIKDKSLREQMGLRGRKIVEEKFSERIVIKATLDIYDELLN